MSEENQEQGTQETQVNPDEVYPSTTPADSNENESKDDSPAENQAEANLSETNQEKKLEGKEEEKASEDKSEEKSEEMKLTLPEESFLSQSNVDELIKFAKENNLSQDQAQGILKREDKAVADYVSASAAENEKVINGWAEEAKADPEIGGEAFKESVELSKRVIEKFGSQDLIQELNATGYGNHPELVRVLQKIGKAMSDETLHFGSEPKAEKTFEEHFYPNN